MHDQLTQRAEMRASRPIHTFKVPPKIAKQSGINTLGIVELLGSEEIMASRRAKNDAVSLALELAKESLRAVNGKPVQSADGSVDTAWEQMHPKVRQLVVAAYTHIHTVENAEAADFIKSHELTVD